MYLARLLNFGESAVLYSKAQHPYTKALISACSGSDPPAPERSFFRAMCRPGSPALGCYFLLSRAVGQCRLEA
jgi:ABC-type oligopeptide transport system ATPase subunit